MFNCLWKSSHIIIVKTFGLERRQREKESVSVDALPPDQDPAWGWGWSRRVQVEGQTWTWQRSTVLWAKWHVYELACTCRRKQRKTNSSRCGVHFRHWIRTLMHVFCCDVRAEQSITLDQHTIKTTQKSQTAESVLHRAWLSKFYGLVQCIEYSSTMVQIKKITTNTKKHSLLL